MKIGIDFDGTIAFTNLLRVEWIKANTGIDVQPLDTLNNKALLGEKRFLEMMNEVHNRENTLKTPEVPHAIASIKKLSKTAELHLVTARKFDDNFNYALDWLKEKGVYDLFSGFHSSSSKETICNELGIQVLIDDNERYFSYETELKRILLKHACTDEIKTQKETILARSWEDVLKNLA